MNENGHLSSPSPKVREALIAAVENCVRHCKRSLLDSINIARQKHNGNPEVLATLEFLAKRVHNDVSIIRDQFLTTFQVYEKNGEIPPFGRSEEERTAGR